MRKLVVYRNIILVLLIQLLIVEIVPIKSIKITGKSIISTKTICISTFLLIDIIMLILIMCNRGKSVGTDLSTYLYYYDVLGKVSKETLFMEAKYRGIEYGYALFYRIVYLINSNEKAYMIISSLFIMVPIYKFIKRKSVNPIFSLLLFVCLGLYNQSFNTMRQFMAMGILLSSFSQVEKRKGKIFFFQVIIASLFHKSAIIFFVVYPLYNKSISKEKLLYIAISTIISVLVFGNIISAFLINIMGYIKYSDRNGLISVIMIVEILITFVYIFNYNKFKRYNSKCDIYIYMSIIAVCVGLLGLRMDLFHRMSIYFQIGYVVSIPMFLNSFRSKFFRNTSKFIVIILFVLYYLQGLVNSSLGQTVPYILGY